MQYAIITMINGNWKVEVESNNLQQVTTNFHTKCAALSNEPSVTLARVWVVDQSLSIIKSEEIEHATEAAE